MDFEIREISTKNDWIKKYSFKYPLTKLSRKNTKKVAVSVDLAGTRHYLKAMESFCENEDNETFYAYFETSNPEDENAIVFKNLLGDVMGYVPSDISKRIAENTEIDKNKLYIRPLYKSFKEGDFKSFATFNFDIVQIEDILEIPIEDEDIYVKIEEETEDFFEKSDISKPQEDDFKLKEIASRTRYVEDNKCKYPELNKEVVKIVSEREYLKIDCFEFEKAKGFVAEKENAVFSVNFEPTNPYNKNAIIFKDFLGKPFGHVKDATTYYIAKNKTFSRKNLYIHLNEKGFDNILNPYIKFDIVEIKDFNKISETEKKAYAKIGNVNGHFWVSIKKPFKKIWKALFS